MHQLSIPQQSIFNFEAFGQTTLSANYARCIIKGSCNEEAMKQAIHFVLKNNDAFHLSIQVENGEARQKFLKHPEFHISIQHFTTPEEMIAWCDEQAKKPMSLQDPLTDPIGLVTDGQFGLLVKFHHSVSDGWTLMLIKNQFASAYYAYCNGEEPMSDSSSYQCFLKREQEYLGSSDFDADHAFWQEQLQNSTNTVSIAPIHSDGMETNRLNFSIDASFTANLEQYCLDQGTSIFGILMFALGAYVKKQTAQNHCYIGTSFLNRITTEEKNTMGMFANTVAVPVVLSEDADLETNMAQVTDNIFSAMQHQQYPYTYVQNEAYEQFDAVGRLYDIVLVYQAASYHKLVDCDLHFYLPRHQLESLCMHAHITKEETLEIIYNYHWEKFTKDQIQKLHDFIEQFLHDLVSSDASRILHTLPVMKPEYIDLSAWFSELPKGYLANEYAYWQKQLHKDLEVLEMPVDVKRAGAFQFAPDTQQFTLHQHLTQLIESFSATHDVSSESVYLAIFQVLIMKHSQTAAINLGVEMKGQFPTQFASMSDPSDNLVMVGNTLDEDASFIKIVQQADVALRRAKQHSVIPFDQLMMALNPEEQRDSQPLLPVVFSYRKESRRVPSFAPYDYHLSIDHSGQDTRILLSFNQNYHHARTALSLLCGYDTLASNLLNDPKQSVGSVNCTPKQDIHLQTTAWNAIDEAHVSHNSIVAEFVRQASNTPDRIAVTSSAGEISYGQLDERSNYLAGVLVRHQQIKPHDVVALLLNKSINSIIAMLAVLKAGGTYLPIDTSTSSERLASILEDGCPKLLLLEDEDVRSLELKNVVEVATLASLWMLPVSAPVPLPKPSEHDVAYIIFTSGTTGKPKGAMIEHHSVTSLIKSCQNLFHFTEEDVWSMFHACHFDMSVWEMYGALLTGGRLVIVSREQSRNSEDFRKLMLREGVTVLSQTPLAFDMLSAHESSYQDHPLNVKRIIFGGEALETAKLRTWQEYYPHVCFVNMYGITETTVHTTYKIVTPEEIMAGKNSIGIPLPSYLTYVVDKNLHLTPTGVVGELLVGGSGVARGYINRPDLTSERFIKNPFGSGRLYRSGDLGRFLPDGSLEYFGRLDNQVKIRGFRVELGEIENTLREIKGVQDAAVVMKTDPSGEQSLCGYIACSDKPDLGDVRTFLTNRLPYYMVPPYLMHLPKLPLTINGKLDRRALPDIAASGEHAGILPRDSYEEVVAEAFREILGLAQVTITDNFFDIGGHSLRTTKVLNRVESTTGIRLTVNDMFANPTIEGLSKLLRDSKPQTYVSIPAAPVQKNYIASSAQQRIYMAEKIGGWNTTYNMSSTLIPEGDFDPKTAQIVLDALVKRHQILRTGFEMFDGEVRQVIHEDTKILLKEDHSTLTRKEAASALLKDFMSPFDLSQAPLLRIKAVNCKDGYLMLFEMHHIIGDGETVRIFTEEFLRLYTGKNLPVSTCQYIDYSEWMRTRDFTLQKSYWINELSGEIPLLELPTDYPRPVVQSAQGGRLVCSMSADVRTQVAQLANQQDVTEFMVLLSAVQILLYKYSGQSDIIVGSPVSGRTHEDTKSMLGVFVNMLPLRASLQPDKTVAQLLSELKNTCLHAYEHQDYPFEELLEIVDVKRDTSRHPLFDVVFAMQNTEPVQRGTGELSLLEIKRGEGSSKFDLTIDLSADEHGYEYSFEYCTDLFQESTIRWMMLHFEQLITALVSHAQTPIGALEMLDPAEKNLILHTFNHSYGKTYENDTVTAALEEQAALFPDKTAVRFGTSTLTYGELNGRANQLAAKLLEMGVGSDTFVAIMAEHTPETIIGQCGIIKAGGAYVPLDPNYPVARLQYILQDCTPKAILTVGDNLTFQTDLPVIDLNAVELRTGIVKNPKLRNQSHDLIYCMYTSGTTGNPKGTLIEHHSVIQLTKGSNYARLDEQTIMLQAGSLSFDACTFEIWGSLLNGGVLCLADQDVFTQPSLFRDTLKEYGINTMFLTSALFQQLVDLDVHIFDSMVQLLTGGDRASRTHFKKLLKHNRRINLINGYGPTECTTFAVTYLAQKEVKNVPIGKPIAGTKTYILQGMTLCGIGVPGELCIAGEGVARGYLNQKELTKKVFVDNPFGTGRLYRTGDYVRLLPDGNLEYLGRLDDQVKIRGFRIELQEITNVLLESTLVSDAAVVVRPNGLGEPTICAYTVGEPEADTTGLKEFLRKRLPEYMIPSHIMTLKKLPLTVNGKVDQRALPEITFIGTSRIAPRNSLEELAVAAFEDALGVKDISVDNNFFDLGGHSLRATKVINQLEADTGIRLDMKSFFTSPTPELLAKLLQKAEQANYTPIPRASKKIYYPVSSAQKRLYVMEQMDDLDTIYNMSVILKAHGNYEYERVMNTFEKMVARHEILRTSFIMVDGIPMQQVHKHAPFTMEYVEIDPIATRDASELLNDFITPFDLTKAPLMHLKTVKAGSDYYLLFDLHHIIADGMSLQLFTKEFLAIYDGKHLDEDYLQYKDYSEWMHTQDLKNQQAYWKQEFADEIPVLELITDYPRPQMQSFAGNALDGMIDGSVRSLVSSCAQRFGATEYMVLLTATMIFLHKYSGQEDIVVGSPVSARTHRDTQDMLGMFVNMLPIRSQPVENKKVSQLLTEVREKCLKAYENQDYPFEELVETIQVQRDFSRNPIFDVILALQNTEAISIAGDELSFEKLDRGRNTARFDLTINVELAEDGYHYSFDYCTALFSKESICLMMKSFEQIIENLVKHPDMTVGALDILGDENRNLVQKNFNCKVSSYSREKTIIDLFEEQAAKHPDHIAIRFGSGSLTYGELNRLSNQVARQLQSFTIAPDDFIAITGERNMQTIIGMCAILKAGAAYVPLDTSYPAGRLEYILDDCKPKVILETGASLSCNVLIPRIRLEELLQKNSPDNPSRTITPQSLMYVIYTSGTSGKPKGVLIEHQSVVQALSCIDFLDLNMQTVFLQTVSLSFDPSILEIWGTLIHGGTLCMVEQHVLTNSSALKKLLVENKVNTMMAATSLYNQLIDSEEDIFDHLEQIIIGGEKISEAHVRKLRKRSEKIQIVNAYGPTENTITTTTYVIGNTFDTIPIGSPIPNSQVYILQGMNLCGIGMPGELCIAGASLARGYLNQPELTKTKFISNPFRPGQLYRSGDLACWLPDGNIRYLGRIDGQVKIRGFRIELEEIEHVLRQAPGVKDGAVAVKLDAAQEKIICAYVSGDTALDLEPIRQHLQQHLPHYMVPTGLQYLEQLPITPNGKVNYRALPDINLTSNRPYYAPVNEQEQIVADIFAQVLGVEQVSTTDSFYELGGDSIKAIRVISKMREAGFELSIRELMQHKTVGKSSAKARKIKDHIVYEQGEITGRWPLSPIQKTFFDWNLTKPEHFNQSVMLQAFEPVNKDALVRALDKIVAHHDMLRGTFAGEEQIVTAIDDRTLYDLTFHNLSVDEITATCSRIQEDMELAQGPLVKVAVLDTEKTTYMMICIHHLVMDGVSYRIILEDLYTAYTQAGNQVPIVLPSKTASYGDWTAALSEYGSHITDEEIGYWKNIDEQLSTYDLLSRQEHTGEPQKIASIELSEEETTQLLYEAPKAYDTEINDLLLSALSMAIKAWTGQDKTALMLESHGRQNDQIKLEIGRTVGWFTNMYPIILTADDALKTCIINTKEMLLQIPNHGCGYSVLRQCPDIGLSKTNLNISFNYLGNLNETTTGKQAFTLSSHSCGSDFAVDNQLPNSMVISGKTYQGSLSFTVYYQDTWTANAMRQFLAHYKDALIQVTRHCLGAEQENVRTNLDFELADMQLGEIANLNELINNIQ